MINQLLHTGLDRFLEGQLVSIKRVIGSEAGRGVKQRVVENVLQQVRRIAEAEHITDRIFDAIAERGAGMNDVAVAAQRIAVHAGAKHPLRLGFLAGCGLLRRLIVPASRGSDGVGLADRDINHIVNRIRKLPVKSGLEQLAVADADGLAEAQLDGDLIRFDGENTGQNEGQDERTHQQFDDVETAPQRFGQRPGADIFDAVRRVWRGFRPCRSVFVFGL